MNVNRLRPKPDQLRSAFAPRSARCAEEPARAACVMAALASVQHTAFAQTSPPLPQHLRDTGLFASGASTEIAPGRVAFSPQYPLWSDGATKRRWIALPPGTSIDAREARRMGVSARHAAVEGVLGRHAASRRASSNALQDGSWRYATYVWNEGGTDAVLAPADGIAAVHASRRDARYTIPSESDCRACHEGAPVPVLGFSALQLSSDRDPLAPHAEPAERPRSARARGARLVAQSAAGDARSAAAHRGRVADRTRRAGISARQLRPLPQQARPRRARRCP